jgi:hypothetical protein
MRHAGILVAIALVAGASARVSAQSTVETTPVLNSGDTLRVWSTSAKLDGAMGVLARLNATELVLAGQSRGPGIPPREWSVPLGNVERIDVLQKKGRSGGKILAGTVIGAGVGSLIGGFLVPYIECGGACDKEGTRVPFAPRKIGFVIGGGVGAILGGVVGGISRPKWHTVALTVR